MIAGRYTRIDFRVFHKEKRKTKVKIGTPQSETKFKVEKIVVQVKTAGTGIEGKMKGKTVYQTFNSIDVIEATPSEVYAAILRGLEMAAKGQR
jgi:hypothetical protein